jgi:hypothetical protein
MCGFDAVRINQKYNERVVFWQYPARDEVGLNVDL